MKYFSLVKFSHSIFSLPFALIGFLEALKITNNPDFSKLILFTLLALVSARTAAMGFNRIVDRHIDAKNERTKNRELPSGKISLIEARILVISSIILFMFSAYMLNWLCLYLSPVALLIILGYSYTKRVTSLSHFILGLALGISPLAAYIAVSGKFDISVIILGASVMFWTAGFDIIYSLQDYAFDKKNKLHSIPASIGNKKSKQLAFFIHLISLILLAVFWYYYSLNIISVIASIIFSLLVLYQHIIIHKHGLNKINLAFFTLNGTAGLILGLGYLLAFLK